MNIRKQALAIAILLMPIQFAAGQVKAPRTTGEPCSTAHDSLPVWRPPAGAVHGIQEFHGSVHLTLPIEVSSATVEMWGGGGGGGSGSAETQTHGGAGGGGGASGSYVRGILPIVPGATYTLIVGSAGEGASVAARQPQSNGRDGGDSVVCGAADAVLLVAHGGYGGLSSQGSDRGGAGGKADSLMPSNSGEFPVLRRNGNEGKAGSQPLFEVGGPGGRGGEPVLGSIEPRGSFGGAGGNGETGSDRQGNGSRGGAGVIIISW